MPVKVDASFGAIEAGDPLTSSPVPGVAMKATRPGPIVGTALEAHTSGEAKILALIHRGFYPGEGEPSLFGAVDPPRSDAELAALRSENARMQARESQGNEGRNGGQGRGTRRKGYPPGG